MTTARDEHRLKTVEQLAWQLCRLERSRCESAGRRQVVSTGLKVLDRLLPDGGLTGGTLLEWLATTEGSGAATLVLLLAGRFLGRESLATPQPLIIIDSRKDFYPPAAAGLGIDLDRTFVVRPESAADALWALEQSLRCRGVAATLAWIDRVDGRASRRLKLAVEAGGGLGLLLRPGRCLRTTSCADARLLVRPVPSPRAATRRVLRSESNPPSSRRRLQIELLRSRKGHVVEALQLELSDETPGVLRVASSVADPAPADRAAEA